MERIDELVLEYNKKSAERKGAPTEQNLYVMEDGHRVTVPYKIIKQATFSNVKRDELIDLQHAARLQYRIMLLDAVIKATVNFVKGNIMIIYNPITADNIKEKLSIDELIEFLVVQGVNVDKNNFKERDYDYYKEFFTYAYSPPSIRQRAPYGHTEESWAKEKPVYDEKIKKLKEEKNTKFAEWQQSYLHEHPEIADKMGLKIEETEEKKGLFNKKKAKKNEKGFWFHGI